jgi:glycerol-3-phosphate dehydrogenase (NAD(P)+)
MMETDPGGGHGDEERRAAVIGAGSWGSTVASMLAHKCDTVLWAREPEVAEAITTRHENPLFLPDFRLAESLRARTSIGDVVAGRQLIVMAVPVQHMRAVAQRMAPLLSPTAVVVSLAKGIEHATLLRPSQILAEVFVDHDPAVLGVVSGPNLAREVMAGQPSATVVAAPDQGAARRLQSLLMSDRFRVYTSQDVIGCEIGGAVKNVIAIAAGIADGLGYGWNTRAALITRGLAELTRLGVAVGGETLTFLGLAGNGDLIATCSSPQSRNRRVGVELGKGRALEDVLGDTHMVAEGVTSTPSVLALAREHGIELPISTEVHAVLVGERSPAAVVESLMQREATIELHDLPITTEG